MTLFNPKQCCHRKHLRDSRLQMLPWDAQVETNTYFPAIITASRYKTVLQSAHILPALLVVKGNTCGIFADVAAK